MKCRFIYWGLLVFAPFLVYGQTGFQHYAGKGIDMGGFDVKSNTEVLSAFSQRFSVLDSVINHEVGVNEVFVLARPLGIECYDSLYKEKGAHERKAFLKKSGLELTGQVYHRFDEEFGFDDENDQYSRYLAKFQGELGWNFFNSSFLQRKSELRLIDLTNKTEQLQQQRDHTEFMWHAFKISIDEKYNRWVIPILQEQLSNAEVLSIAYSYLLTADRIDNSKFLEVINEKNRLQHAIAKASSPESLENTSDGDPLIEVVRPVVVEVDSMRLFDFIRDNHADLRILKSQEEILELNRRLTNYAQEMRFTPFVRLSHYLRRELPSSTNIEAGVRFTFPLYDDTSKKRKALTSEKNIKSFERQHLYEIMVEQCRQLFSQLEKLNKAVCTESQHTDMLRKFISIRKEAYMNSLNGYNHIARLEEYNEYLKSLERIYELLRLRNICLLDIQKVSGCMELTSMITVKEVGR